tara:strand:- start:331 stop:1230 length:900 start_codon:yes stop_codon:yes gene_type:complete
MVSAVIDINLIRADNRIRAVTPATVTALADSISDVGLLNPITVYAREIIRNGQKVKGYGLIAGAHRLDACKSLGWGEIPANVSDLGEQERIIAECDENLCGSKLSPADVAMFTARRKEAYIALHPETANGSNQHNRVRQVGEPSETSGESAAPRDAERFTAATAAATGQSERDVQRSASRGESITPAVLAMVRGTKLDTGVYLDKLKAVAPEEQVARVDRDLREANKPKQSSQTSSSSKIDADVKSRAAKEVAEIIAEHVPADWWDAVKSNLYSAGAKSIADQLANITGESIMDKGRFK